MPDYTFTTDAADEAAIARWMEKLAQSPTPEAGLTVQQVLRRVLRNWIATRVSDQRDEQRLSFKVAYEKASAEDKAALDLILNKYRGT